VASYFLSHLIFPLTVHSLDVTNGMAQEEQNILEQITALVGIRFSQLSTHSPACV